MPKPKSKRRAAGPVAVARRRKAGMPRANGSRAARRTKLSLSPRKPGNRRVERDFVGRLSADHQLPPSSRGKYVYCIINSERPLRFGQIGIGAEPTDVYSILYRNLAAIVF